MTTLEVQPKDFPTSIPSTVSYNQGTTGFGSILPSQTDDSRLRGDRADLRLGFENDWRTEPTLAAREAEEIGMRSRQNVSTQNEKIGRSSRILATRRELSSSSPKRTPKRLPGRSPFTKFGTRSSQLLYRTADFIDSQDLSPESKDMGVFNFNTKSAPGSDTEDIVSKYSPKLHPPEFEETDSNHSNQRILFPGNHSPKTKIPPILILITEVSQLRTVNVEVRLGILLLPPQPQKRQLLALRNIRRGRRRKPNLSSKQR
jgi:hypothetical protein